MHICLFLLGLVRDEPMPADTTTSSADAVKLVLILVFLGLSTPALSMNSLH